MQGRIREAPPTDARRTRLGRLHRLSIYHKQAGTERNDFGPKGSKTTYQALN
jgi:hypothetical protein